MNKGQRNFRLGSGNKKAMKEKKVKFDNSSNPVGSAVSISSAIGLASIPSHNFLKFQFPTCISEKSLVKDEEKAERFVKKQTTPNHDDGTDNACKPPKPGVPKVGKNCSLFIEIEIVFFSIQFYKFITGFAFSASKERERATKDAEEGIEGGRKDDAEEVGGKRGTRTNTNMEVESSESKTIKRRVGLLYDDRMCKHHTPDGDHHPENPYRIKAIWNKLQKAGIPRRCVVLNAKEAEDKYILSVHSKNHVNLIRNVSTKQFDLRRNRIASNFNSIYLNEGSSEAAYLAAGSVIEVADRVAKGELNSAFAVVRPPGHHAEQDEAMGFCLYNNVAIAASFLLNERPMFLLFSSVLTTPLLICILQPELGINKILIVDWDVHHGNGTQKMFWKDPRVLFFSVHRHEFGTFYPANDDGFYTMIGEGPGAGYNINVPWENGRCGDADYLAVWDHILLPVAKEFVPDIIIVSAGFDAVVGTLMLKQVHTFFLMNKMHKIHNSVILETAAGDPLGGCRVTPYGYSVMLNKLMGFAQGKIVLALEGGYNLESISNSVLACMEVLLEHKPISGSSEAYPFESTWRVIQAVRHKLSAFWPTLADELPTKLTSQKAPPPHMISSSDSEDEYEKTPDVVLENLEAVLQDVIEPLSKLKVEDGHAIVATESAPWRSELSKVDVWYASFGSNMWKPRFLCYIQGGQVEGMKKACSGSMDRNPPKETLWKTFPHRLFFGRNSTRTWGPGGVAFLNPESNVQEKAYLCLNRITLEQFNDVLRQENVATDEKDFPFLDITALNSSADKKSISVEALKKDWYHNVVYLGKERNIPILTITCSPLDFERFKSGEFPLRVPAVEYANTLIRGLVEGEQLSEKEAMAYIHEASTKKL
ncbi:hypothetical protein Pint_16245 [Pistacia integerrima]|uniref:Uncharacterized protein n=1 Tax=Pistacia integerrima TaxID=434235 RepID=A0ACC0Z909_9ROSI|nr:hypothetical protein Pint_16245 [Pistacia integerrima]